MAAAIASPDRIEATSIQQTDLIHFLCVDRKKAIIAWHFPQALTQFHLF